MLNQHRINMKKVELIILLTFIVSGLTSCNQNKSTDDWGKLFQQNNVNGTFVLKDLSTNKTLIYNKERSYKEFVPASTFKILNSLIALQVSAIASVDDTIKWDGVDRKYNAWNNNQTMKTALPISCVWFYQELARRTGEERMQKWITKADYGNKTIENKIDRFWLDGKLTISAK